MGRIIITIIAGLALACVQAVAADPPKCNLQSATHISVREIAKDPKRYNGSCVFVSGIISGWTIFADVDAIYQRIPEGGNPSSNGGRLGLSPPTRLKYPDGYLAATVIGVVADCQEARDIVHSFDEPGKIVMIRGYCHGSNGPYISVIRVHIAGPAEIERQLMARTNADYGDLEPAPNTWPHTELVHSFTALFLNALRRRDGDALAALHFPDWKTWSQAASVRPLIRFLISDPKSPFADIRQSASARSIILIDRGGRFEKDYTATVCFCRRGDCAGRWPIATWDADNLPSRPYACTTVGPYLVFSKGERTAFNTPMAEFGLPEPR